MQTTWVTFTVKYGPKSQVACAALFQKTAVSLGRSWGAVCASGGFLLIVYVLSVLCIKAICRGLDSSWIWCQLASHLVYCCNCGQIPNRVSLPMQTLCQCQKIGLLLFRAVFGNTAAASRTVAVQTAVFGKSTALQ